MTGSLRRRRRELYRSARVPLLGGRPGDRTCLVTADDDVSINLGGGRRVVIGNRYPGFRAGSRENRPIRARRDDSRGAEPLGRVDGRFWDQGHLIRSGCTLNKRALGAEEMKETCSRMSTS